MMEIITKYFKGLSHNQIFQFTKLEECYKYWNSKINVISRKDIDHLYERHILHSLAIAKILDFVPGTKVLDVGTGGGFPGIPLAIFFPEVQFHLIDSIAKKIKVVNGIIDEIDLKNCSAQQMRSDELKLKYDFVVSRAVSALPEFYDSTIHNIHKNSKNSLKNGIIYLKGGDLTLEIEPFKGKIKLFEIQNFFEETFFESKKVVYIQA
jgi:16S rRNA (guanine527-N7)-methyltransferase